MRKIKRLGIDVGQGETAGYVILKDVPIPDRRNTHRTSIWRILADKMEIGDSVVVGRRKQTNLCNVLRELGFRAVTRRVDRQDIQIWKMSKEEALKDNGQTALEENLMRC